MTNEPSKKPQIEQLTIRLPPKLRRKLESVRKQQRRRSLSETIVVLLEEHLA